MQQDSEPKTVRMTLVLVGDESQSFELEEGSNLLGRWDPESGSFPEVDLTPVDVDAKISRKHAVIERKGDKAVLSDIGSLNGTFIGRGERMEKDKPREIRDGEEIVIGKTRLKLRIDRECWAG